MTKNLVGFKKEFAQSQGDFTNMLKEQNRLCIDLKSAKIQIKSLHSQNIEKNLKLQRVKAELNQYDLKYRKPELEFVREHKQRKHAWEKRQKTITNGINKQKPALAIEVFETHGSTRLKMCRLLEQQQRHLTINY